MFHPDVLKKIRKERGLTQKELSAKSKVSENAIKQYEGGKRNPRTEQLEKLAEALGVSPALLLGVEPNSLILSDHEKSCKEIKECLDIISACSDDATFDLEQSLVNLFSSLSQSFMAYKEDSKTDLIESIDKLINNIDVLLCPDLINNKNIIQSINEVGNFVDYKIKALDVTDY